MLTYYNNSLSQALIDLFPDIGLERSCFLHSNYYYFIFNLAHNNYSCIGDRERDSPSSRRMIFETYAKYCGFNPSIPSNWYKSYNNEKLKAIKVNISLFFMTNVYCIM